MVPVAQGFIAHLAHQEVLPFSSRLGPAADGKGRPVMVLGEVLRGRPSTSPSTGDRDIFAGPGNLWHFLCELSPAKIHSGVPRETACPQMILSILFEEGSPGRTRWLLLVVLPPPCH